ncbi:MAG: hypothetical protein QXY87_12345 [Saccharolobus sp.]|uniref:Uncharacterized protein n=1 Tax=Saccharolobus shibatae (strain ATCC 51178 / DSM 5389 / JCM 8931 / NBRC 15437 / B12) TaxID=523848 RepID=A0A8F5BMW8_SACSH|nr:hypothetical protein [Saccharolobus shibatae]MCH4815881.1 hypothetical protein [Saccharolobus shibatae]QXJ28105.1 hypothetical protein J5U23_00973 [Saccharolobus shibatae B12]
MVEKPFPSSIAILHPLPANSPYFLGKFYSKPHYNNVVIRKQFSHHIERYLAQNFSIP